MLGEKKEYDAPQISDRELNPRSMSKLREQRTFPEHKGLESWD